LKDQLDKESKFSGKIALSKGIAHGVLAVNITIAESEMSTARGSVHRQEPSALGA
jgi:hypothetical protein